MALRSREFAPRTTLKEIHWKVVDLINAIKRFHLLSNGNTQGSCSYREIKSAAKIVSLLISSALDDPLPAIAWFHMFSNFVLAGVAIGRRILTFDVLMAPHQSGSSIA